MLFTRLFVHLHSQSSFWWHVDMTTLLLVHVFHAKQNVWQSSRGSFSPPSSGHKNGENSVQRPSVFDATTATLNAFYEKKSVKRQNYWWRNVIGARSCTGCFKSTRYFSSNIFQLFDNRQKTYVLRFHSNLSSGACLSALSISRIFSRISRYLLIFLWVVPANGCGTS